MTYKEKYWQCCENISSMMDISKNRYDNFSCNIEANNKMR